MSDRESIKQDHINDLLAQEAEWRERHEWPVCHCETGVDPDQAVGCEECGAAMHRECAVPLGDDATYLCPACHVARGSLVNCSETC